MVENSVWEKCLKGINVRLLIKGFLYKKLFLEKNEKMKNEKTKKIEKYKK